jgi:hypothetical protein
MQVLDHRPHRAQRAEQGHGDDDERHRQPDATTVRAAAAQVMPGSYELKVIS